MQEIRDTYGSLGVVAYSCKVVDSVPLGGYVIAVQEGVNKTGNNELRSYQKKLRETRPDLRPVFYFCLEEGMHGERSHPCSSTGSIQSKLPEIRSKYPSCAEKFLNSLPDEVLAGVVKTANHMH